MDLEKINKANTKFLGKHILYFKEITSTQEIAKQMADEKLANGSIVLTDFQTQGKGTKDRKWLASKEKNIMMTLILYPHINISKLEGFTIKIAQAIQKAIYQLYGYELTIKQPNDLLLNGKKIAGILTQSVSQKEQVTNLYIGIGFNVNEIEFPEELQTIATSLRKEFSKEFEREEIIAKVLEEVEKILEMVLLGKNDTKK